MWAWFLQLSTQGHHPALLSRDVRERLVDGNSLGASMERDRYWKSRERADGTDPNVGTHASVIAAIVGAMPGILALIPTVAFWNDPDAGLGPLFLLIAAILAIAMGALVGALIGASVANLLYKVIKRAVWATLLGGLVGGIIASGIAVASAFVVFS